MAKVLFLLLLFLSISSLSLISASHFEGFDSDEASVSYEDEDLDAPVEPIPTISLSTPLHSTPDSEIEPELNPPPENPNTNPNPTTTTPSHLHADLWDEDEFEGIPSSPESIVIQQPVDTDRGSETKSNPESSSPDPKPATPAKPSSYWVEILCGSFLICFIINYFTGRKENETIALTWASKFATKDSIFEKNFSLLGTGDGNDTPLLLKEGQDMFKFYASGRRYCQGMLATMYMHSRHDLIARIVGWIFPKKDTITIEVVMNDDAMDHVVLAVARKKEAKAMQKDEKDLQRYALPNAVAAPTGKRWVSDELAVISESKDVASDLFNEAVLDQVFGDKAFEKVGKWFISLHFSDQQPGMNKKVLLFKFVLPDINHMADITKLVALVPYYIDVIGRYKLSSQARSKTEGARSKAAQEEFKEMQSLRQEAAQRKKAERKKQSEEAEAKLSAEALRKKEEKERARQLKKSMPRVKMMRT
ncbi:Coiled-coil domain-containing protein 47 [Rhynchospora pubera]|uniref:Coiled-coil domain-containing protein 47 n=1 Tax=Rhynchospora pubera TaxID=906938 RepID=A0AAV8CR97_9POAL|nr:Coiled-coil domain-containing protein 47 [Rhynchospora pubera]